MKTILLLLLMFKLIYADIDLVKFENKNAQSTLLIVGGIHGNEPGGYFAPAILSQYYSITSNNLWIIPNLNKASIIANKRGVHGDMNRKFANIKKRDKDKQIIKDLKKIILNKKVSLILNLHDGHGFYRKKYNSTVFNPRAWGQTCVIDQCDLKDNSKYGNMNEIAEEVTKNINKKLLKKHHIFDIRNTKTKYHDEEMQHSLTYFAVTNNKPAFAIETSKNLSSLTQKVFYQLVAIEEFMKIMDISFVRHFELSQKGIEKIIKEYGTLKINSNISLNLTNIRNYLSYIPLKSSDNVFEFTHPLGQIKKTNGKYQVYIGHKIITTLKPQYFNIARNCPSKYKVIIDGKSKLITSSSEFYVKKEFLVVGEKNIRTNVIGYSQKNRINESNININYHDMNKKYSIDNSKKSYRIEFYNQEKFCSMSMVHFK